MTKKQILKMVSNSFNIPFEYLDLIRFEGEYYWGGKVGAVFTATSVGRVTLKETPLQYWVEDFNSKFEEFKSDNTIDIIDYIESIDWKIEEV